MNTRVFEELILLIGIAILLALVSLSASAEEIRDKELLQTLEFCKEYPRACANQTKLFDGEELSAIGNQMDAKVVEGAGFILGAGAVTTACALGTRKLPSRIGRFSLGASCATIVGVIGARGVADIRENYASGRAVDLAAETRLAFYLVDSIEGDLSAKISADSNETVLESMLDQIAEGVPLTTVVQSRGYKLKAQKFLRPELYDLPPKVQKDIRQHFSAE